jgi:hypothetical protein
MFSIRVMGFTLSINARKINMDLVDDFKAHLINLIFLYCGKIL